MNRSHCGSLWLLAILLFVAPINVFSAEPTSHCPGDAAPDRKRSQAVLAQLRSQQSGKRLVSRLGRAPKICYGNVREGVVQSSGVLVLQRDRSLASNAARLGHLLLHLVHGLPFDDAIARTSPLSCGELVQAADAAEKRAHRLESELRKAFGLASLAFEDLSAEYRARCQALRQK